MAVRDRLVVFLLVFLSGYVFAIGLCLSGMTQPDKVFAFLNVLGNWDPSLILVMLGASFTFFIGHTVINRASRNGGLFALWRDSGKRLDPPLILGSGLFGVGWGLVGFCPGPAIVGIATGLPSVATFVFSMFLGMFLHQALLGKRASTTEADET